MPSNLRDRIRNHLARNYLPPDRPLALRDEDDLFDTGVLDSAALLSFLSFVERETHLSIPDEDLLPENFATIGRVLAYVNRRKRAEIE